MNPRAEIWNILHDGGISEIEGSIPGEVRIRVSIPYLRHMFPGDGKDILVRLTDCSKFSMRIWEGDIVTDNLKRIMDTDTEILSTESEDVPVHVFTTLGELDVDFEDFSLSLDNGNKITFGQICTACENYWNRWEAEAKQKKSLLSTGASPTNSTTISPAESPFNTIPIDNPS